MPRGDGTGPNGMGPMTGRRAGYCAGYGVPGYMNGIPAGGRGYGYGWGYGRGYGRGYGYGARWGAGYRGAGWYVPPVFPEDEQTYLEHELKFMEQRQNALRKRLDELKREERTSKDEQ